MKELRTKGSFLNPENEKQVEGMLLWDTGATTVSCINSKVVPNLNLELKGITQVHTANGIVKVNKFNNWMT